MLNWLDRWIGLYFAGTYFHMLEKRNGRRLEYHWYFAVTSIFLITTANFMFVVGVAVTFGHTDGVLSSKIHNAAILIGFFSLCWIYFVWRGRYRNIVRAWKERRIFAKRTAMRINGFLFGAFAVMVARVIMLM